MKFRWGILGLGKIARKFADGLKALPDAELLAVASRSVERSEAFGAEFDVAHRYSSYEELVDDPGVDAVYIATPHSFHYDDALLALKARKPVLCEKSLTINAVEAKALIDLSVESGVFLMEAMWTRFLPAMFALRELVDQKAIGDLRMIQANFGFRSQFDSTSRLFDPQLGGGALLDLGIYPISFASMLLGSPQIIHGAAEIGTTGVDEQSAYLFKYASGEIAVLSAAVSTSTANTAVIYGTKGRILVEEPWWMAQSLVLTVDGEDPVTIVSEFVGNGYNYEAAEVAECVRAGRQESTIMPLSESLAIMQTMDTLRSSWGLVYPQDRR